MARAFTEEERQAIRQKLLETALELVHDKGKKSLSIAELTRRAGIAQGSFYSFWDGKDALIADLISYRARQKLDVMAGGFAQSVKDPEGFLSRLILDASLDMTRKIRTQPIYKEAFTIFRSGGPEKAGALLRLYGEFIEKLCRFWQAENAVRRVDQKGLENALIGSFALCAESSLLDPEYFEDILRTYIESVVSRYIER